ncbi:MAG: hypothetical protein IKU52_07035 [Clostridia bacterium]|nr:hypothetical protein [Clostridia bacterium]
MKKAITKKIIITVAVILALGIIAGGITLFVRSKNKLSDSEASKVVEELLPEAEKVNEIIWGKGVDVAEGQTGILETVSGPQYRLADKSAGYENTEDILKAVSRVYSSRYIEGDLKKILFEGDREDSSFMLYQRYMDNDNGELLVNITHTAFENIGENKIDPKSVKVTGAKYNELYITAKQKLFDGSEIEISLTLIKQKDGWRFDGPTY